MILKSRKYILIFIFALSSHFGIGQNLDQLITLTNEYISVGGWITAAEWAEEAKAIISTENSSKGEKYYYIQGKLAQIYTELADYTKAQTCFNEVLEWNNIQKLTETLEHADLLNSLADLYQKMGLYQQSEDAYTQSLTIKLSKLGAEHQSVGATYNNLGNLFNSMGVAKIAEDYYLKALTIKNKEGKNLSYAYTLNNLAELYAQTKKDSLAEIYYLQSLEIKKEIVGEEHLSFAQTMSNLALLLTREEKYDKALEYYLHSEKIMKWKLGEDHPQYNDLLFDIGMMMEKRNLLFDAQNYYHKVLDNLFLQIDQYFPSLTEQEKNKFYSTLKLRLEHYDAFALKRYKADHKILYRMYDNQLHTKAIILNENGKVKTQIQNSSDQELKSLYAQWQKKKDEYAGILTIALTDRSASVGNKAQLEQEIQELEKQLALKSSLFRHSEASTKYNWKSVYMALQPNEAAVEMIRFHDNSGNIQYLALILRKGTRKALQLVVLPEGKKMEEQYLNLYKNSITHRVDDIKSYNRYWSPIYEKLGNASKVYVSPDGVYNQLNLNTLYNPDSSQYVLNEINIHMVTKTSDIIDFSGQDLLASNSNTLNAVLFGRPDFLMNGINSVIYSNEQQNVGLQRYSAMVKNAHFPDLPGTELEVEGIADLMKGNSNSWGVKIFTGVEATENALKQTTNPTLLHIATHGFFIGSSEDSTALDTRQNDYEINPMLRSGLILAGVTKYYQNNSSTSDEDGILTAMEATNLTLDSTQLVVLSACETGLGEIEKGEGVYGMFRALKIAGAKTVLMSQWKVDDTATQELMHSFYQEWMNSGNKHEAFKIAQNKIKLKYENPYYWGAFVMIGE